MLAGRFPKPAWVTLRPPPPPPPPVFDLAPAGADNAPLTTTVQSTAINSLNMAPPGLDDDELQPRELAQQLPGMRLPAGVEHLMVRPPEAQPGVHAVPHSGVRPEVP